MSCPGLARRARSFYPLLVLLAFLPLGAAPPARAPLGVTEADLGGPLGPETPQKPNNAALPEGESGQSKPVALPANGYEWLTYILSFPNWDGGGQRLLQKWEGQEAVGLESKQDPVASGRTVMVLGDTTGLELPGLGKFVRSGGTLIIAADSELWQGRHGVGTALMNLSGINVSGTRVRAFPPEAGYQKNADLVPVTGDKNFPWFKNRGGLSGELISNAPSSIQGAPFNGEIVGWFKGRVRSGSRGPAQEKIPFGAVSKLQQPEGFGKVVVLGDPNIFSNQMLTLPGNLAFACNFAEWIAKDGIADGQDKRGELLLIIDGQIVDKPFVPPIAMPDLPFPDLPKEDLLSLLYRLAEGAVQAGEVLVSRVEDDNIPDRAGAAILRFMWPAGVLILATLGVAVWLFVVMTRKTLNQDMAEVKKPV